VEDLDHKVKKYIEVVNCGACRANALTIAYDFGLVPLAGYFPRLGDEVIPNLPMKLLKCEECELFQISPDVSDDYLFRDYRYISSIGMQNHFNELATWFRETQNTRPDSRIVEFGCNDGPLLSSLKELGFDPVGIDPARNIVELAREKGLRVINDFFGPDALILHEEINNADFIFSSNSFAHISDIYSIAETVSKALRPEGRFIVEVQSLVKILETNAFDFVYHEHKYYYTLKSISNLLGQFGLSLISASNIQSHGGSYRLVFEKNQSLVTEEIVSEILREEQFLKKMPISQGIRKYIQTLNQVDEYLDIQNKSGKKIIAFGASGRGNMILAHLPKTRGFLVSVLDESPERIGRQMAQNGIKITGLGDVNLAECDAILVLAWNYLEVIIEKLIQFNGIYITPLPIFRTIPAPNHID
jgi:SAM-dependent methyltransferase